MELETTILFYTRGIGTVQNFFDLFSSKEFLSARKKEVVTGKQREMTVEEQKFSLEDEENFKNLNEIVQELREVEETFRNL